MDAQRFDPTIKQPKPLRASIPQASTWSKDSDEEWPAPFPSPLPPTLCNSKRETPYDAQRFDPFKMMLAAASPPRYSSPIAPEFACDYPKLPDSVTFRFPPIVEADDHFDDPECNKFVYYCTDGEASPGSEASTPGGEYKDVRTTYRFAGVEDDSKYLIDRTIIRPQSQSNTSLRRLKSLATLATRSTTTLRTIPSLSSFASARRPAPDSGTTTPAHSDSDGSSVGSDTGLTAPPVSRFPSRRPSMTFSLSSPAAMSEVTNSLRRLADGCAGSTGMERHFEEAVDYYEKIWPLEERCEGTIEVCVTCSKETLAGETPAEAVRMGRSDGIGIYARSRENTLRTEKRA